MIAQLISDGIHFVNVSNFEAAIFGTGVFVIGWFAFSLIAIVFGGPTDKD